MYMQYKTVNTDPGPAPETRTVVEYHVDAPVYSVSSRLESALQDVEQAGGSVRTVHPDTGTLARIREYRGRDARLDLTHCVAPDGDGYIAEIAIQGAADRVDELTDDLDEIMEDL